MSTGNIRKADVADGIPVVVANATLEYLKNNTVMARLVRRDYDEAIAQYGDTVRINKITGLTVKDKAAATDYEVERLDDAKVEVVLDQHKYVGFLIEDPAKFLAKPDYQADLMNEGVSKIAEQIDSDLLALYSDIVSAGYTVGAAGTDIDGDDLIDARKVLVGDNKAPSIGNAAVISAKDEAALLKIEKFTSAAWDQSNGAALVEARMGRKYGLDIFMDQQVKETGSSPVSTHNLVFNKGAFALVTRPLALPGQGSGVQAYYANADGIGLRVMTSYQHAKGGWMTTIDILYGVKTVRPELAVRLLS